MEEEEEEFEADARCSFIFASRSSTICSRSSPPILPGFLVASIWASSRFPELCYRSSPSWRPTSMPRTGICDYRLLRFALRAAAEMATGTVLELFFDIGTFCSPTGCLAEDLELMADWMLDTPLEVEEEEDMYDYYLEDFDGFGGVPASSSFIKSLEPSPYGRGEGIREKQCIICLEDFDSGAEVSKMACSHTFHSRCIIHWLEESHVCPLCRHEMPTSSS